MACVRCCDPSNNSFFLFHLLAMAALIVICISAPTWNFDCFLLVANEESIFFFGVFGYSGAPARIGYHFPIKSDILASSNVHNLTYTLILHPIVACLSCLTVTSDLFGVKYDCWGIDPAILSSLAALVAFVAFVLDMVLFTIVKNEFLQSGFGAMFGMAMWLSLFTVFILIVALYHYEPCSRSCRGRRYVAC